MNLAALAPYVPAAALFGFSVYSSYDAARRVNATLEDIAVPKVRLTNYEEIRDDVLRSQIDQVTRLLKMLITHIDVMTEPNDVNEQYVKDYIAKYGEKLHLDTHIFERIELIKKIMLIARKMILVRRFVERGDEILGDWILYSKEAKTALFDEPQEARHETEDCDNAKVSPRNGYPYHFIAEYVINRRQGLMLLSKFEIDKWLKPYKSKDEGRQHWLDTFTNAVKRNNGHIKTVLNMTIYPIHE